MNIKKGDRFICKNEVLISEGRVRRVQEEFFNVIERTVIEISPSNDYIGFQQNIHEGNTFWLKKDLFEESIIEQIESIQELVDFHKMPDLHGINDEYFENQKLTKEFMEEIVTKLKRENKEDDWKSE